MCFKERQDRFIEHMNRSHRQLAGIVPSPGMTVLAVQHDFQIHLVPLEYTDDEGIARHQFPNVVNFDLAFAKLRTEALEQANLFMRCPDKIGQSRIKQPEQFSNTSC